MRAIRAGSLRLDDVRIADPVVAADGTSFTYCSRRLAAGQTITLRYVVEYTIAMRGMKDAINTAQAIAPGNVHSNEARALVRMNEELFSQKGFIVGRVFEGTCDADGREDAGVQNVRVYLEDGRYGVTDENGHFHFDGLEPGTHTVQLDKLTLPEYLELAPCADRMGHAGRDYSQFAELHPGTLWRSDFVLRQKAAPKGDVKFEFHSSLVDRSARRGPGRARRGGPRERRGRRQHARWWSMLPDGFEYIPGSATVDGVAVSDSADQKTGAGEVVVSAADGVFTARLGELAARHGAHAPLPHARDGQRRRRTDGARHRCCSIRRPSRACARAPVESQLSRGAARYGRSQFTFTPRFDVLKTELLRRPTSRRCARSSIPGAVRATSASAPSGHADSQQISGRSRSVFADNYALSRARAQTVADYLAISLNVPAARVHVEGRGSDRAGQPRQGCRQSRRESPRRHRHRRFALRSECAARAREERRGGGRHRDRGRRPARSADRAIRVPPRYKPMADKLGMGVVVDVEKLKPGNALAGAARRRHAADLGHQGRDPASAGPDGRAHRERQDRPIRSASTASTSMVPTRWRSAAGARSIWSTATTTWSRACSTRTAAKCGTASARCTSAAGRCAPRSTRRPPNWSPTAAPRPVIALRMFDKYGKPARAGTFAAFSVDSPYRSRWEVESAQRQPDPVAMVRASRRSKCAKAASR